MTDNLFDRLFELLQSPGPVNWKLGAEVAASLAGSTEPVEEALIDEYGEILRTAEMHVSTVPSVRAPSGMQIELTSRREWSDSNLRSFAYLAEPLAEKIAGAESPEGLEGLLKPLAPILLGLQMGSMVGFMSHRVLGQFDVGLPPFAGGALVVPNVEGFASDHQIEPRQARLWAAMHEVVFQAALAIDWVRPHFSSLMGDFFDGLHFDPAEISTRLEGMDDPEELERMMSDPAGFALLVSGPERDEALKTIQGFMAFLEGYADYVMDRIAPELIPEAPRLREAINRRRAEPSQGEMMLQRLVGLEVRRMDYQKGSDFARGVEERWGAPAIEKLWLEPENLPTYDELEDPIGWAARVMVDEIGVDES